MDVPDTRPLREEDWQARIYEALDVFTPGAPILVQGLRTKQITRQQGERPSGYSLSAEVLERVLAASTGIEPHLAAHLDLIPLPAGERSGRVQCALAADR
jgi:hypothetical protein